MSGVSVVQQSQSVTHKYNILLDFLATFIIFSIFISHNSQKWIPTLWNYPTEALQPQPQPDVEQCFFSLFTQLWPSSENLVLIPVLDDMCAGMYQQKTRTLSFISPFLFPVLVCVCVCVLCLCVRP